jgi:hypothetical protein
LSRIFCTGLISGTNAPLEPVLMSIFGLVNRGTCFLSTPMFTGVVGPSFCSMFLVLFLLLLLLPFFHAMKTTLRWHAVQANYTTTWSGIEGDARGFPTPAAATAVSVQASCTHGRGTCAVVDDSSYTFIVGVDGDDELRSVLSWSPARRCLAGYQSDCGRNSRPYVHTLPFPDFVSPRKQYCAATERDLFRNVGRTCSP